FGIKYILKVKENEKYKGYNEKYEEDGTITLENPYSLNLGFEAKDINLPEISETNPFENFNNIVNTFSGIEEDVYTKHMENVFQKLTNLSLEEEIVFRKVNQRKDAYLEYEFEAEKSENAYLYITRWKF
ncbi:MAG: YfhO family protein, partial [Clostridia bacterium]|nr:YfhO family protein [Clostridia bacterium]